MLSFLNTLLKSPKTGTRRRTLRNRTGVATAEIQSLECRQLLTGDFVFANVSQGGFEDRAISSDAEGNTIVVSEASDEVQIRKLGLNGQVVWSKTLTSSHAVGPEIVSVGTDAAGNVYAVGQFFGVMDFDPGAGTSTMDGTFGHGFLVKLDSAGAFQWARQMPSAYSNSVAVSAAGQVLVAGEFRGSYTFQTFPTTNEAALGVRVRGFLSSYDTTGNLVWNKAFGTDSTSNNDFANVHVTGLKSDAAGNSVMTGTLRGSAFGLIDQPEDTRFIVKWTANGTQSWVRTTTMLVSDVALDDSGNAYYTGAFSGAVDVNPSPNVFMMTSIGTADLYVTKLSTTGVWQFTKQFGKAAGAATGQHQAGGQSLTVFGDSIYVTGAFAGEIDFDNLAATNVLSSPDGFTANAFVLKLSSGGDHQWARGFSGESSSGHQISVGASGLIATLGDFSGDVDFDGGIPEVLRTGFSSSQNYVSVLTPDFLFQTTLTGTDELTLRRNGGMLQLFHNGLGTVVDEHPLSQIRSVRIAGQAFQTDSLLIDFNSGGSFGMAGGIHFDAGIGSNDRLQIAGLLSQSATYIPASSMVTRPAILFGSNPITFSGVESSLLSGILQVTVQTPGSTDVVNLTSSTGFNGAAAAMIGGTTGGTTIHNLRFQQITSLVIDTATNDASAALGADSITVSAAALKTPGLRGLRVTTGLGDDQLSVNTTSLLLGSPGGSFEFLGGTGSDQINATGDVSWALTNTSLAIGRSSSMLLSSVERATLTGGSSANSLNASLFSGAVILNGLGGNDTLRAGSGGGTLNGGDGDDDLYNGLGNDVLIGGAGIDEYILQGTSNNDSLRLQKTTTGGTFTRRNRTTNLLMETDTITTDASDKFLIRALEGDDLISVDTLFSQLGTADGGPGADTYTGKSNWTRISI